MWSRGLRGYLLAGWKITASGPSNQLLLADPVWAVGGDIQSVERNWLPRALTAFSSALTTRLVITRRPDRAKDRVERCMTAAAHALAEGEPGLDLATGPENLEARPAQLGLRSD